MKIADISMRQAAVNTPASQQGTQTAEKSTSGGFQTAMEQTRKSAPHDQDKPQAGNSAGRESGGPLREEEQEEILLPQNLVAIPVSAPMTDLFRPEIQPLAEGELAPLQVELSSRSLSATVHPGEEAPAQAPIEVTDGLVGETPEMPEMTVQTKVEQTHAQAQETRQAEGRPQVEDAGHPDREYGLREEDSLPQEGGAEIGRPVFHEVEHVPVKVGESYRVDTESPDMDVRVAGAIRQGLSEGARQMEVRLTPEHLGALTVRLTQSGDGTLQVVLHAENSKAAELLGQHLDGLHQALQGLGQSQVHVEVQRGQESAQPQQQFNHQADPDGRGQQHQQQQQRQTRQVTTEDFLHQLRLGLLPLDEAI